MSYHIYIYSKPPLECPGVAWSNSLPSAEPYSTRTPDPLCSNKRLILKGIARYSTHSTPPRPPAPARGAAQKPRGNRYGYRGRRRPLGTATCSQFGRQVQAAPQFFDKFVTFSYLEAA